MFYLMTLSMLLYDINDLDIKRYLYVITCGKDHSDNESKNPLLPLYGILLLTAARDLL